MATWKESAGKNETLAPYMDMQVVAIMATHTASNQTGYISTLANFRTASPAMIEDSITMLRRNADANVLDALLREFHEMFLNYLQNAGQMEETATLARYF